MRRWRAPESGLGMRWRGDQRPAPGVGPDRLLTSWAHPHEGYRYADVLGDELEVFAGPIRQVGHRAALAEVLLPASQLGQLGGRVVEDRLVVGEVVELRPVGSAVAKGNLDAIHARGATELGHPRG